MLQGGVFVPSSKLPKKWHDGQQFELVVQPVVVEQANRRLKVTRDLPRMTAEDRATLMRVLAENHLEEKMACRYIERLMSGEEPEW